jgi:hypothetical protein
LPAATNRLYGSLDGSYESAWIKGGIRKNSPTEDSG